MGAATEPNEWEAFTSAVFNGNPPAPEPEPPPDLTAAPVIDGQGNTPAPPEGMPRDTRALLNLISLPALRSY